MNLPRLRELHKAWYNQSIRHDEMLELRDMLPEVIEAATRAQKQTFQDLESERRWDAFKPGDMK